MSGDTKAQVEKAFDEICEAAKERKVEIDSERGKIDGVVVAGTSTPYFTVANAK